MWPQCHCGRALYASGLSRSTPESANDVKVASGNNITIGCAQLKNTWLTHHINEKKGISVKSCVRTGHTHGECCELTNEVGRPQPGLDVFLLWPPARGGHRVLLSLDEQAARAHGLLRER